MTGTVNGGSTWRWWWRCVALAIALSAAVVSSFAAPPPARADGYVPIQGAGSTWSFTAIHAWIANVAQFNMVVTYEPKGSSDGRNQFRAGTVDWAASDIPYGVKDGVNEDSPKGVPSFAYMPDTAGGTTFMYNLKVGTRRVTNLRLSGANIAKIFTGVITQWNDPAIAKDNPGLTLPAIKVVPVVRSDGSGSTAQFTQWMFATQRSSWTAYCAKTHRNPCTQTSAYPVIPGSGMVAQQGDLGVSGYVAQNQTVGSIGYVEYSYAIQAGFPVAKLLNKAGYYTEPTAGHVAVSLLKAKINMDKSNLDVYLTQNLSQVYANTDPRTYPLSSYSYLILPTDPNYNTDKGRTIGDFGNYLLCQGQTQVNALGYSALPINLVRAGQGQLARIHGARGTNFTISKCHNPTFSTDGSNTLAKNDPKPAACDRQGPTQCASGTGGAKQEGPTNPGSQGSGGASGNPSGANSGAGNGTSGPSRPATTGPTRAATQPNAQPAACDPDTGVCGQAAAVDTNQSVFGRPTSASASLGDGLQVALMVLAAVLLVGLALGPPLIAHASSRRRSRRTSGAGPDRGQW